jgi:hypothetical protein
LNLILSLADKKNNPLGQSLRSLFILFLINRPGGAQVRTHLKASQILALQDAPKKTLLHQTLGGVDGKKNRIIF